MEGELIREGIEGKDLNTCKNINIGILGHIDSGKTSFAKFISTLASTASMLHNTYIYIYIYIHIYIA